MLQNMRISFKPSQTISRDNTLLVPTLDKQYKKEISGSGAPNQTNEGGKQLDSDFDMKVFERKENVKTLFGKRRNIE